MSVTKRSSTARSYPVRIPRVAVGPLAPTVLSDCSAWSAAQGYSQGSAAGIGNLLERLSMWMQEVGAGVDDLDEDLLVEFVAVELSRELPCSSVKRWTGTMRRFLASGGYLNASRRRPAQLTPVQAVVEDWRSWMRGQHGLTAKTIAAYCHYAAGLLDEVIASDGSVEWDRLDAADVNAYAADRGRPSGGVAPARAVGPGPRLPRRGPSTRHPPPP